VGDRVRSTIFNALTPWQKVKLISGTLGLDDLVGSQFAAFGDPALVETPISFTIKSVTELGGVDLQIHEYEITGRLILKRVGLDPCKRLSDAMIAARAALEEIEDRLQGLYDDFGEAPTSEKPIIQLEIDEIENVELPPAEEAFAAAVEALAKCRGRIPPTPPKDTVLTHA
jgi:hypothetical protein